MSGKLVGESEAIIGADTSKSGVEDLVIEAVADAVVAELQGDLLRGVKGEYADEIRIGVEAVNHPSLVGNETDVGPSILLNSLSQLQ